MSFDSQPRDDHGRWTAGAKEGLAKLKAKLQQPDTLHTIAVSAGKLAGGAIGGHVGGSAGAYAGSLLGALATRQVIHVMTSAHTAQEKLERDERFARAQKLEQLKQLGAATLSELRSPEMQEKMEDDLLKDVAGWALGHSTNAIVGGVLPQAAGVPLKGAAVTMAVVPKLLAAKRKQRASQRQYQPAT